MDLYAFARECYLRSVPSVDLDHVTKEKPVNCSDHKLKESEYDKIMNEFNATDEQRVGLNMWCLLSGPSIIRS
jgi:hypothetical protein